MWQYALHLDYPVKPDNDRERERPPDNDSRGRKKHCRCLEFFAIGQKIGMTIKEKMCRILPHKKELRFLGVLFVIALSWNAKS